jgi:hypothetical protein
VVFFGAAKGALRGSFVGSDGSPTVCVRLEGDGPLAEELVLLLVLAAGRDFWCGSSLVTTAQFSSGLFGSSPSLWWWCSVLLCELLLCVFCVVVFTSACYVKLLLLLK